MASRPFDVKVEGTDLQALFRNAKEDAAWEHGHGGYTGTIAEKDRVILRRSDAMTEAAAGVFIWEDNGGGDGDVWQNDKFDPAWAIPLRSEDSPDIFGYLIYGLASS